MVNYLLPHNDHQLNQPCYIYYFATYETLLQIIQHHSVYNS